MIKVALLSNVNLDSLRFRLRTQCELYVSAGYGTWQQELLDESSGLFSFAPEFCFIILYNDSANLDYIETASKKLTGCRFFVSDIDETDKEHIHNFPLHQIIYRFGQNSVCSPKMWYLAGNPFSALGEKKITEKMLQLIRPARIPSKKCLVLDLDGTLWGGVIGEDGVNGIKLDRYGQNSRYYDFQREILKIHDKGILLAIASKNNPEDVEDAFKHPCMLLRKEHFSAIIANWQPKSDSMKQIAEMLKIGIDSLVFVDDNPVEREEVRQNSSEVTIADFPEDTSLLSEFSIELYDKYFYSWTLTNEDLQKTRMYADNKKREESKKTFANLDDFLKDMNIKMSVQRVDDSTVARAFQLIYKTNQFNLTTRRYTESEIAQMISDPNILFLIGSVKDRFGDNGYTILCVAIIESETEAKLDSFLMSCRIMGRKIEFSFLKEVESMLATMGVDTILAEYIPSNKNLPCRNFYNDAGYNEVSEFKYTLQRTIINN